MITRKPSKVLAVLALLLVPFSWGAQRAETFPEAVEKAGSDGVIAYCYGPDWNRRSVMLLNSFWKSEKLSEAAGDAILVAVPFYEDKHSAEASRHSHIGSGMPNPAFSVCPTVMFFDKNGRMYASMQGNDYFRR